MLEPLETQMLELEDLLFLGAGRPADVGTRVSAQTGTTAAPTLTFVPDAETLAILPPAAPQPQEREASGSNLQTSLEALLCAHPKYVRDLIWAEDEGEAGSRPLTLARASEFMPPLSPVPTNKLSNTAALNTIRNYPHLFNVSTSVNIPAFRHFLRNHPNRKLVESVCLGLEQGFWPRAETARWNLPSDPSTLKEVYELKDDAHVEIAKAQRDIEIKLGCFSPCFSRLLPGMLAVPVTISERNPQKPRLCVDHSAEPLPRNAMIPKAPFTTPLDSLQHLGRTYEKSALVSAVTFASSFSRVMFLMPTGRYQCIHSGRSSRL